MRFPWTKQSEKASNLLAIVDQSQTKVSELEHELAVSRAELGQLQQTIERQGTLLSGMYEIIQKSAEAPPTYRWDNPWRYASPHSTKRKPEAIAPLELLRNFARTYDVLRSCINHLKREVRAVPFEIVSRDPDKKIPEERIKKAKEFFGRNGGLGGLHTRTRHFENAIFEDVMVIGAYAVFLWKKRNGTIHEAVALDASTIRPKVDVYGWQDPNEAFEQQILGVPYRTFGKDELLYDGLDPVTYSPYFVSPVEYLLGVIMSALSADNWNRSWLTDGNTPDALISVPETWTPEQVIAYQEYFDAILSGNASERRKTRIVPSGTKSVVSQTRHEADFQEFETWLMRRTCSIMGVAPASIGYAGDQYKESQGESMRSTSVFGAGALLELRKDLYDDLLEMNGFADLEIRDVMAREEDPTVKADRLVKTTGGAFKTINEARSEEGLDPIEGGDVIRGLNDSPEEEDPDPFEPDEDETEAEDEQRLEDLAKWERKALKRLREGKGAQCEFRSDFLDEVEIRSIFDALGGCEAADEVATLFRTAFKGVQKWVTIKGHAVLLGANNSVRGQSAPFRNKGRGIRAACKAHLSTLPSKLTIKDDGREVHVTKAGIKHILAFASNGDMADVVYNFAKIVENSTLQHAAPYQGKDGRIGNEPNKGEVLTYTARLRTRKRKYFVLLTVQQNKRSGEAKSDVYHIEGLKIQSAKNVAGAGR